MRLWGSETDGRGGGGGQVGGGRGGGLGERGGGVLLDIRPGSLRPREGGVKVMTDDGLGLKLAAGLVLRNWIGVKRVQQRTYHDVLHIVDLL